MSDFGNLENKAKQIRRSCVNLSATKKASHLGCALSMTDVLVYLYYKQMNHNCDEFILSKGHAVIGLYSILLDRGILTPEEFNSYRENGSFLIDHPHHKVNGISISTGALGHGPAIRVGGQVLGAVVHDQLQFGYGRRYSSPDDMRASELGLSLVVKPYTRNFKIDGYEKSDVLVPLGSLSSLPLSIQ